MEEVLDIQQQVPTQEEPPIKKLYNGLYADKKYTKSFDEFKKKYSTPEAIDVLYNGLKGDGDYTKSKEEFQKQYFQQEPTPSKKKESTVNSANGGKPISSPTPSKSLFGNFGTKDEYIAANPVEQQVGIEGNFTGRKKRIKSVSDYLPSINSMRQPAVKDETFIPKPITDADVKEKLASTERHNKNVQDAIDNTTEKYFKIKGINAPKGSALYNEQKAKVEKMVANKDATYHMGKDGKPGLDRSMGWWEGITKGWDEAMNAEDEAEAFTNMTTKERIEYANKKIEEKPPSEYIGEQYGLMGSAGHLLSSSAPFLAKATGGAILGTMTGGTGAPIIMSIAATAPDMINQGMKDEVLERYQQLKKENPNVSDEENMKIAEGGMLSGGVQGAAENLLFIGTGLKAPLSMEGKMVLGENLTKTLTSSTHVGLVTGAVKAAGLAERKAEGYDIKPQEIINESVTTAVDNFTGMLALNGLLHGITGLAKIPKNVLSAFKYGLKDVPTSDIQAVLKANEKAGKIPEGAAELAVKDIEDYKSALAKTSPALTPESQASVAGLMQARDYVESEMQSKDATQREPYAEKINWYNDQIKKITETNEPLKYEVDDVTGKPLGEPPTKDTTPEEMEPTTTDKGVGEVGSGVGGDVGSKLEKPYKTVNDGSGKMVKVVVTTTEKNGVKTTKFKTQTTNKQGESREQNDKGFNTFEEAVENLGIDLKSEENESALELIQAVKESQGKENIPVRVTEIREGTDKSSPFYGKKVATLVVGGEKVDVILEQSLKETTKAVEQSKPQPTNEAKAKAPTVSDVSSGVGDVEATAKAIEKNPIFINNISGDEYYHGTSLPKSEPDFTTANKDKGVGVRSNAFMGTSREQKSPFFFITSERDVANDFSQAKKEYYNDELKPKENHTSRIIPFKFDEKNSKVLDLTKDNYEFVLQDIGESPIDFFGMGMYEQDQMWEMLDEPKFAEKLKSLGYDAVKFIEPKRGIGIAVLNTDKIVNSTPKGIAEAYHKAKADGSNPELVKAVEQYLPPTKSEPTVKEETSTVSDVSGEGSVGVGGDVELKENNDVEVEGRKAFDIFHKGKQVGTISLEDKGTHYEVSNAKVSTPNKGIGTEAYKQLISTLDKPLISDKILSQGADALWRKLEREGFAKYNEKTKQFETVKAVEQSLKAEDKAPVTKPEGKSDVVVDKVDDVGGDVVGKTFRDNYNRTFEVKGENAGILTLEDVDTGKVLRKKKSEVLSDFKEITDSEVAINDKIISDAKVVGDAFGLKLGKSYKGDDVYVGEIKNVRLNPKEFSVSEFGQEEKVNEEGAENIDLSEPIEAEVQANGAIKVTDGHHRLWAARKLGKDLNVNLTIPSTKIKEISPLLNEIYQNSKADGTNPELVKAVEQSLSKPQPTNEAKAIEVQQPTEVESTTIKETNKVGEGAEETQKTYTKNALDRADAKKIYAQVREVDVPQDAAQIALEYIANGGKVSEEAINQVAGSVKRASLNTGRKEKRSAEYNLRDYASKTNETLDALAHRLWEDNDQRVSEMDIKDALMDAIGSHSTRLDAGKTYLERYSAEYQENKLQEKFYQEHLEEIAAEEKAINEWLNSEDELLIDAMADEKFVTNLIEKYESETKGENKQSPTKTESSTNKRTGSETSTQKTEAGEPPIVPPGTTKGESEGAFVEPKRTEFSHRGLQEVATEFGLNDITSREKVSDLELFKRADETITKWQSDGTYQKNVSGLIEKAKLGEIFSPEQNVIMAQHIANMREKTAKVREKFGINSPEYNKALQELQNITTIGQKVRSDIGAALRVPNISRTYMETLDEAMAAKMEAAGVDVLTEKQKAEVEGLFNEYKKRAEVAEAKLNEANQRLSEFNAEQALKKGTYGKKVTPKTKEEFKEQRKSLREKLQQQIDEYKVAGQKLGVASDGGTESFIISTKIAKTVLEIVRSHVAEVGVDLKEVTKKTFEDVKDLLKGISEKDVHDIIAGEYNEKRKTRNQLAADMRDVKDEATLINKLNKLLNGEIPTKESAVVERNSNIKELREKIKGLKDEMPLTDAEIKSKLLAIKKRNEAFAKKIREDIENGNFEKEPKKSWIENKEFKAKFPVLFKEALNSIAEREDAKHEMDIALYKDQQSKRNAGQKFLSFLGAGANTTKKIVTGVDDSAIGIQTLAAMIARPVVGGRAIKLHAMDAFSQKRFERTLAELHNSPDYDLMVKSGLDITEPKSLLAEKKEEIFSGNTWDIKFKLNGKEYKVLGDLLKPFERAFTSLGNGMRVIAFRTIADKLAKEGRTFENSPQIYKDLATMLNTETGRGKQNEYIQKASELVTKGIWSPRLMASRLNMLGISDIAALIPGKTGTKGYYNQLDPRIRKEALADLVKFSTGVLALSYLAAWALGGELDKDPKSQTFMDIKVGDKSYNLSGGFSQYIRFVAQSLAGGKTSNGEFKKFDNRVKDRGTNTLHFLRGKVTPMTGVGIDLLTGTDFVGNPVELDKEIKKLVIPLSLGSLASGIEKDGVSSLFTTTFPNFVGVNVKDKQDFIEQDLDVPEWRFLSDKGLRLTKKSKESLKPVDADGKPIEVTEDKYKEFLKIREEYVRKDIQELIKGEPKVLDKKGGNGWVDLPKSKLKDIPYDKMEDWLMGKTSAANDKAMKEVFPKAVEPPKDKDGDIYTR